MNTRVSKAFAALLVVSTAAPVLAQTAPPYPQPPPAYQPPPSYQPPPAYQPPPNYQQPPPDYRQQQPPPNYQQPPPDYRQQQPPPNYQQPPPAYPPAYAPPPPGYAPPPAQAAPQAAPPQYYQSQKSTQSAGIKYHPFRIELDGGYTMTTGKTDETLQGGGNVGIGLLIFPSESIPIGLRITGSWSNFNHTLASLAQSSQVYNQDISDGYTDIYGGDADLEIDLHMGHAVKEYFFGGFGYYKERTTLKSSTQQPGFICFFYCQPGYITVENTVAQNTSDWLQSWNAGMGFEFALHDPATLFIEARYMRIQQNGIKQEFIPFRIGLRF
jgi:opacity protein-like surface antigen